MAALTIPYIVPLFLGMTFDARSYSPGVFIYDKAAIDNAPRDTVGTTSSQYAIITSNSDIREALDISGELALKIKTGNLDIKGSGSYVKNDEDLQNSVVILFLFKHISAVTSLPKGTRPKPTWMTDFSKKVLGTHYVKEVVYGVEMIASLKFTATNSSKQSDIKGEVTTHLEGGKKQQVDLQVSGQLEKIAKSVKNKANMEISYFGTLPLISVPNSIEGVQDLIKNFDKHVKTAKMEKGLPMEINLGELKDLTTQTVSDFQYTINTQTKTRYEIFQDGYLRLSEARDKLFSWSRSLPFDLSEASSEKIGELMKELNDDLNLAYEVISNVDLSADSTVVDRGNRINTQNYMVRVRRLIEEVDKEVAMNAQVTTDTYIHWGNIDCPGAEAHKLYDGYTITSSKDGIGGMAKYECMPSRTTGPTTQLSDSPRQSVMTGVTYGKIDKNSNPFKGEFGPFVSMPSESAVPCAKCHLSDASTVSVFSAATKCPPSWQLKYTGFLMSGGTHDAHTTQYICVDDTPPDLSSRQVPDEKNSIAFTQVQNGGSLPPTYVNDRLVPCAVCVLKGGRLL